MGPRGVAAAAAVVLLAGGVAALVVDEPPRRITVVPTAADARPGLTPVGFTAQVGRGSGASTLDDEGNLLLGAYVGQDCTTMPTRIWRTGTGDLVVGYASSDDETCGSNGPFVGVRVTLADGPVVSGTALLREADLTRSGTFGTVLVRGDEPVALTQPGSKDCGRTTESFARPAAPANVRCLADAMRVGSPAVLRVRSVGTDSGSEDTYEVVGRDRVRFVRDAREIGGLGGRGVLIQPCVRVTGQQLGFITRGLCATS